MKKLELAQVEKIKAEMKQLAVKGQKMELALLLGDPYDAELPVNSVLADIFDTSSVPAGEVVEYFVPVTAAKTVYTLVSCAVTNVAVTPGTDSDLSFSTYTTSRFYICVDDLLNARYNVIANKTENMLEALDRLEEAKAIALVDAAVPVANQFVPDSGETKLSYPKLVEMVRVMAKYGSKFVLITGANVTADVVLMDYDADKVRAIDLSKIGIEKVVAMDGQAVTLDGTPINIIDADTAYLIAVADKKGKKAGIFVRRQIGSLAALNGEAQIVAKERIVLPSDAPAAIGNDQKLAWAFVMAEQFGAVITNAKMLAKFTRA